MTDWQSKILNETRIGFVAEHGSKRKKPDRRLRRPGRLERAVGIEPT